MKLKRLVINRLPGINQPFEIEAAGAGFHVVFGPNGIGKSSICRAVEGLYWDDRHPSPLTSVTGEFDWDGASWWAHREGPRVTWRRDGANSGSPGFPPPHHERCFFLRLRDLIDLSPDGAADIAAAIRRQMSGGFDLDGIAAALFPAVSLAQGRGRRRTFNDAAQEVDKEVVRQSDLQGRADQLGQLKSRDAEAEAAARRRPLVERAIGLARRQKDLARVVEEIAALPAPLAKLTGKEDAEVQRCQDQADTLDERARSLEQDQRRARATQQETALDRPIERPDLAVWRGKADDLRRIEQDLDAARIERAATRLELTASLSAMGVADVDGTVDGGGHADVAGGADRIAFTLAKHGELFEFLRSSQAHRARADAIRERLRLIERIDAPDGAGQRLAMYREATEALRAWLRAPEPDGLVRRVRDRWFWLLLALALVLAGLGVAAMAGSDAALLAALLVGLGGGFVLSALLVGGQRRAQAARRTARAAFEGLSLDGPGAWETSSVAALLRRLEQEIAADESRVQRAHDHVVERQSLENEMEGLSGQEAALAARREALRRGLGVDAPADDAEIVDFARAVDQCRSARVRAAAAKGKLEALERQHATVLAELAAVLEQHGEPAPADAAESAARIHNLADRSTRLEQALSDERNATVQLAQTTADRETACANIRRIYAEASVSEGDLDGLVSLLGSLPRYHELARAKTSLEGQIGLDRAELDRAGESALAECDEPALDELKGELSDRESSASGLKAKIAEVTAEMKAARSGAGTQKLLAVREAARAELQGLRDRALYATAGRFFIHAVEEEYEHNRLPRVFERARDHFSTFTHHHFRLELDKGGEKPRLFAREARSGEARGLDALSDGTRAQLLLAARIAYAEEVEQGKVLPLFLDEALDQSDPQRFEAIVRSLGRVAAAQDRQIFYLSADPLDVERIQRALGREDCGIAAAIDLGRIRTQSASVSGADALRVDPAPAVPAPDGLSIEEYGAALAVPEFRPERGWAEQHFFYVLWDDLGLLCDFLSSGIECAGQWQTVCGTPLAESLASLASRSIAPAEITARIELLEVFCDLWMHGRHRPVDRVALEESGVLTDRYLDDVADLARELDGDPARLLAALDENQDSRLRGFRQANVGRLRDYLTAAGYLDERPVLAESELALRARTTPAAAHLPDRAAGDCLTRWCGWARTAAESEKRQR